MTGAVIPSLKLSGKHRLDQFIRETYAGYSNKITVPKETTIEELHKDSSINIYYKKFMKKKKGYYRHYYYRYYSQKKPGCIMAISKPTHIQRKHTWER